MPQNASRLPGRYFLQIPGPTPVPDRVLRAIDMPLIDQRGPEFAKMTKRVLEGIKTIFKTTQPVIIYTATGTGAWEAALTNTLSPGDRVLMVETGQFATLWKVMAERLGLKPEFIKTDWRVGADPKLIEEHLRKDKAHEIKAVCVLHSETATGCLSPIGEIRKAIDAAGHPALFLVDTISWRWIFFMNIPFGIVSLMILWGSLFEQIEKKKVAYTPRRFTNEVEGWWHASARKPLVESDILALFDKNTRFISPTDVNKKLGPLYLGVDWGGGTRAHTVAWIWQLVDKTAPQFSVIYVERIDKESTEEQADYVAKLVDAYDIEQGVMDGGGGPRQVQKLEARYAEKMIKCLYISRPEKPFEFVSEKNQILVDRTWAVETMIDLIKRPMLQTQIPRISIPAGYSPHVDWIPDHFTCIQGESVDLSGGKKYVRYTHPEGSNDDALHSSIYAHLAWYLQDESRWSYISV